jgi:hypothetical protein
MTEERCTAKDPNRFVGTTFINDMLFGLLCGAPATKQTKLGPRCDRCAALIKKAEKDPNTLIGSLRAPCATCGKPYVEHVSKRYRYSTCGKFKDPTKNKLEDEAPLRNKLEASAK